jgi:hypothetical protein
LIRLIPGTFLLLLATHNNKKSLCLSQHWNLKMARKTIQRFARKDSPGREEPTRILSSSIMLLALELVCWPGRSEVPATRIHYSLLQMTLTLNQTLPILRKKLAMTMMIMMSTTAQRSKVLRTQKMIFLTRYHATPRTRKKVWTIAYGVYMSET